MALQPLVRDFEGAAVFANGYREGAGRGPQWVERVEEEGAGRMEEDTELEEGETVEGGPPVDDLDLRFGYLDTKIEAVLGDCQKEFQGSLFADKLGSKVGCYGSFLPTHVRGAPVLTAAPQVQTGVPPRSRLIEGQMERGPRISGNGSTAVCDTAAKVSAGIGIRSRAQVNGVKHSIDGFSAVPAKGNKRKGGGLAEHKKGRSITVRINLGKGVNKVGKKAMYNGFGLDNSSSPSTDEDPPDAVSASEDEQSTDRSPLDMIRIMTSYFVPLGGLLSPLSAVLAEPLERKDKLVSSTKFNKKLAGSSAIRPDLGPGPGTANNVGKDAKVFKEKIDKKKGKLLDDSELVEPLDSGNVSKKNTENYGLTGKEEMGNGPKAFRKVLVKDGMRDLDWKGDKVEMDVDERDVVWKGGGTGKDPARSLQKDRVFTMDALKEYNRSEALTTDSREVRRIKEESIKDFKKSREISVDPNLKETAAKETLKERRKMCGKETVKARKEDEASQKNSQKQHYRKDVGKHVEAVVVDRAILKDGALEVKKRGRENTKGQSQNEVKDKVRDALKDGYREMKEESTRKELLRDVDEDEKIEPKEPSKASVHDGFKESADMGKWHGTDQGLKDVKAGRKVGKKGGKDPKTVNKENERDGGPAGYFFGLEGDRSGAQLPPQPLLMPLPTGSGVDTPAGACLPAGQLVLDHWVQCDKCQHWRLLIPMIDPDDLPDKWLCKMMTWLPGLNNCKFSEDVTTAAVYELLGLQNPTLSHLNPALQAQQLAVAPALAPLSSQMLGDNILESKPVKSHRPASKKGMGKRLATCMVRNVTSNVKRMETCSVKSKSLSDVGQYPLEQVADKTGLEVTATEDVDNAQVLVNNLQKVKQKEKVMSKWTSEGVDYHLQNHAVCEEDRNLPTRSCSVLHELGKAVKLPVTLEVDNGAEGNVWADSLGLGPSKQQKGKVLQHGNKPDSSGGKRRKKSESSEENDELRCAKKRKVEDKRNWRLMEATPRSKAFDDPNSNSLQLASDEDAVLEGESGHRSGVNIRTVARGSTSDQPLKKVKMTLATGRDRKIGSVLEGLPESQVDERNMKIYKKKTDFERKRDLFERHESSDSEKDGYGREEPGRFITDKDLMGKAKSRERDPDAKKRVKGDEIESGCRVEKRQMASKPDMKDWGGSRGVLCTDKKGQIKRISVSPRTEGHPNNLVEDQSREADSPRSERVQDLKEKNTRLFDEISGIARTYAPMSFEEGAGESPNRESHPCDVRNYADQAGKLIGESQLHSPPSSSSEVSYSAESSAFGSKGGSPIESTVSSSPVRSLRVGGEAGGRGFSEDLQNNHTASQSQPSDKLNCVSPSPKRLLDQEADAQSDREGALLQPHRNWDDRPHSLEPEREFRGSGRDAGRESGSGRVRDDWYALSTSRDGGDFRKYDRSRNGRDDDRYWEEDRETRAGSASYFADRYDRHRDDRYREREDSVDRYRKRENRYERRSNREDRFWDRERDRERDRSREKWITDRGGDVREERYSRERSVRQDRGGRPPSRESRLDKPSGLNWHDESRLVRDVGREGRDRLEDDNTESKHEIRSNHVEGLKDDHPGEDHHEAAQDVQKDDAGSRFENIDLGPPKDTKCNFLRAPVPGLASHGWEGNQVGVPFSGRKDPDAGAPRNGLEGQTMASLGNGRSRVDIVQGGSGTVGVRGKVGQVDGALDVRIVEDTKKGKEQNKGADEGGLLRVSASKTLGSITQIARATEGASLSPTKKEHAALAKGLSNEAKHLKHSADRLKSSASMEGEIPNLYLQASLKFLQAAHHFEMASLESAREGYTAQSVQLYNETARFFDFCATTYERQRDLAAAALAHICAAVARFRGLMGKSASLNKDLMELQNTAGLSAALGSYFAGVLTPPTGLPPPPPPASSRASDKPRSSHGVVAASAIDESPSSSSASDVDNLNNHALTGDKGLSANAVKVAAPLPTPGSVSGSTDLVPQRLHGNLQRMIQNGIDLFIMMESWTKAQNATAAAEIACAGVPRRQEGMVAVRRVVEIGLLGNMDAVVRQVRLALEAIDH